MKSVGDPFDKFIPFLDIIHKYARDIYQHRFPELESLVPQPMDYLKVILVN